MILLALTYLAVVAFGLAIVLRALKIARMPLHLRWELYPVPHDANAAHGGSVLENLNWWRVRASTKHLGDLKVMAREILLLDGVREHNRSLWLRSYPFHGGLYLLASFLLLLGLGAIADGLDMAGLASALATVTVFVGVAGFILLGAGALGLLLWRLADPALRTHSAPADLFNLVCFCVLATLGLATFALADGDFACLRGFARSLLTLEPVADLPTLVVAEIVVGLALLVYLPLSHMSHFFTKWFMYHSVRWDDQVNRVGSGLEAKIQRQLGEKVTWAAAHVGGGGGKNWVDVATAEVKK
jgi:nitrate reductase gamma subunit